MAKTLMLASFISLLTSRSSESLLFLIACTLRVDSLRYLRDFSPAALKGFYQAHISVSIACVLYLTQALDLLNPRISEAECAESVANGYHEFNMYATEHWIDHIEAVSLSQQPDAPVDEADLKFLSSSLDEFTNQHDELYRVLQDAYPHSDGFATVESPLWLRLNVSSATQSLLDYSLRSQAKATTSPGLGRLTRSLSNILQILTLCRSFGARGSKSSTGHSCEI